MLDTNTSTTNIDERTRIPLFAALTAAITLIGFSFWATSVYSIAVQAERVNEKQETKLEMLYEMRADIAVIKKILEQRP